MPNGRTTAESRPKAALPEPDRLPLAVCRWVRPAGVDVAHAIALVLEHEVVLPAALLALSERGRHTRRNLRQADIVHVLANPVSAGWSKAEPAADPDPDLVRPGGQ